MLEIIRVPWKKKIDEPIYVIKIETDKKIKRYQVENKDDDNNKSQDIKYAHITSGHHQPNSIQQF